MWKKTEYVTDVGCVYCCVLQIAGSSSWHARYTVLTYLQIMVFYNLFTFMSDQKAVNDVRALVIRLLEDEQLEVKSTIHLQLLNIKILKTVKLKHCHSGIAVTGRWLKNDIRQSDDIMIAKLLANTCLFMLAGSLTVFTVVIQHSPPGSPPPSPAFQSSSCCYGNHRLQ